MATNKYKEMIFIAAPREISVARFKQILRHYLPKAPIVLGISNEPYVVGFENQPQFRMLHRSTVQPIVDEVNKTPGMRLEVLEYNQNDLASLLSKQDFSRVLLINGSWQYTFQNHPAFTILHERRIPFKYISPFVDEDEAKKYEGGHRPTIPFPEMGSEQTEREMLSIAAKAAKQSYDYSFQTGVALGKKGGDRYEYLMEAFNKVVPYQTYALHHGNAREKHGSGVHDINHYDTIHAEMYLLTKALEQKLDIVGTSLFINLLPCSTCARTLSQTGISEVVYQTDHSEGYAVKLLEAAGKVVRRMQTASGKV